MALGSRSKASAYEVRCPRCDVSFAPETRTCLHCGGPTGPPSFFGGDVPEVLSAKSSSTRPSDYGTTGASSSGSYGTAPDNTPIGPQDESPFSAGRSMGGVFDDDRTNDRELETGESSRSMLGTLVQSLGGIIWVLLLIGFSLARSCGE